MAEDKDKRDKGVPTVQAEVSMEEIKLLETIRMLGLHPKVESPEDLERIREALGESDTNLKKECKQEQGGGAKPKVGGKYGGGDNKDKQEEYRPVPAPRTGYQYPKLGNFFGEEGKGDISWKTFKYEIEAVRNEGVFSPEEIATGIRRAVKGAASDKLRRMGPDVTLDEMLSKLERDYGNIESRETILMKFYTCTQKSNETLESYSSRAEELFEQAISLGALRRSDTATLKGKIHAGLNKELKHISMFLMQGDLDYDAFKVELRRLETALKESEATGSVPCKPVVATQKNNTDNEMKAMRDEMKELFRKLTERMEQLEKVNQEESARSYYNSSRNERRGRGLYSQNRGGRGRGQYQTHRPIGSTTFQSTCYHCNQKGHTKTNCPTLLATVVCFRCNKKGHRQRECPN